MSEMVERVARAMHDAYEAAARENGWVTQLECRVTFDQLPAANRLTMFASARAAIEETPLQRALDALRAAREMSISGRHSPNKWARIENLIHELSAALEPAPVRQSPPASAESA